MLLVYLLAYVALSRAETVCYPPCGCFSDDEPFDNRDLPESPTEQALSWHLFTRGNPEEPVYVEIPADGSIPQMPAEYDASKPVKYIAHGWNAGPLGMYEMKDTFLKFFDVNVMVIDWQRGAFAPIYPRAASNARVVGACSTVLAADWHQDDLNGTHCIGFSLGAQVCSYMGKEAEGEMERVTGLDPAGPWFSYNDSRLRIDIGDAQYVDVIHTNGLGTVNPGLGQPVGHVDFFPNNARRQPPCPEPSCDHGISVRYWINSMEYHDTCPYYAYPCESEDESDACMCETCVEGVDCQLMGYYSNTYPGQGSFFLRTTEESPYCEKPGEGPCSGTTMRV